MIEFLRGQYKFLCNFHYPCVVEHEGLIYPSSEHAYQASKTLDILVRQVFTLAEITPDQVKRLGRAVACRPSWDKIKDGVMYEVVQAKFEDPWLRQMLLATGDEQIQEGNDWNDQYWGICNDKGLNKLGKTLMQVRENIREKT